MAERASVKKLLVLLTLPITLVTFGLFLVVINGLMLMLAAAFVDGFEVGNYHIGTVVDPAAALGVGWETPFRNLRPEDLDTWPKRWCG